MHTNNYITSWGLSIENINLNCPHCNSFLSDEKFKYSEYLNVLCIFGEGSCSSCGNFVKSNPVRIYRDGRLTIQNQNGEWIEYSNYSLGFFKILYFLFIFFFKKIFLRKKR